MNASSLVQKVRSVCNIAASGGASYRDDLEQLPKLRFATLEHEYAQPLAPTEP